MDFRRCRRRSGDEAVDTHEASDEEEDEAEGDADVESHGAPLLVVRLEFWLMLSTIESRFFATPTNDNCKTFSGEDEVEDDKDCEDGYGQGGGFLIPA